MTPRLPRFAEGLLRGRLYVGGHRVHHGGVGAVIGVAGAVTGNVPLVALGAALAYDDRRDFPWPTDDRNLPPGGSR